MQIVYWAHSYRPEDAAINRHFGILIEQAAGMIVNFDPPSEKVNASKLEQNLRGCDGMIAVLTWRPSGPFSGALPVELQPRPAKPDGSALTAVIGGEFDLFERDFLKVQDPAAIERYTIMQVKAGDLRGRYEADTRRQYLEVIMGDQYNVSGQAGAVGRQAHAHDMTFTQAWQQLQGSVDLAQLARELRQLQDAMQRDAAEPTHRFAAGAIAAAEESARQGDGPKVIEYLKSGGKWALSMSEKIGVGVATLALKSALGL